MNHIQIAIDETLKSNDWKELTPQQINDGNCDSFADDVQTTMENHQWTGCSVQETDFMNSEEPGHFFLKYGNKFYDAQCIEGVSDYHQLPIMKRE